MPSKVSKGLKDSLKLYGINLPIDGRYKEWEEQVKKFKVEEFYKNYLKDLVKDAEKKEKASIAKKSKFYEKQ